MEKTTFKTIVSTLKIKLDSEYNLIFPNPLTSEFISAIRTTAITYGIKKLLVFIENILITANINTQDINNVAKTVSTVWLIIVLSSFLFLASIRNLNIDSSSVKVIIGAKKVIMVIIKSYLPYCSVVNLAVYSDTSKKDTIWVLNLPKAIIIVFFINSFSCLNFYLPFSNSPYEEILP